MADVKECTFLSMLPYSIFTSHSTIQYWGTSVRNTNLSENVITILSLMENQKKKKNSQCISCTGGHGGKGKYSAIKIVVLTFCSL